MKIVIIGGGNMGSAIIKGLIKGTVFGLEALYSLKEKYSQLKVDLFGVYDRPEDIPDWITFYKDPENLVGIFNNNSIYVIIIRCWSQKLLCLRKADV